MALMMTGCAYMPMAIDYASQKNDEAVRSAEWMICKGASVGAIRRAYGDRADVWAELCRESAAAELVQ
jgi:hypothetical protein